MITCTFNQATHAIVPIEPTAEMMKPVVYQAVTQDIDWTEGVRLAIAAAPEYPADAGWTLCSDGLPEDDAQVLICTDSGEISVGSFNSLSYDGCWSIGNSSMVWDHDFNLGVTVEKWMPQPAPEAI
jgi:hypothetical protein